MAATRVHLVVTGRVQGVGFRYFVLRQAQALGLTGYVRNLSSAQVEIVAEGEAPALDRLVLATRQGPPGARVDNVQVSQQAPGRDFAGFEVRASAR